MSTFVHNYDGHRYNIETFYDNKVIHASSTFNGEVITGVAKCNPSDTPNLQIGVELAILRCNAKIAKKRRNRTFEKTDIAMQEMINASANYNKLVQHYHSDVNAYDKAYEKLERFLNQIND